MKKSKLALCMSLLLVSAGFSSVASDKECYQSPITGEWVCEEPIVQPMGPGSGGTGGDDEPVKKKSE